MAGSEVSMERIEYLATLSDDELLTQLGNALFEREQGGTLARPRPVAELIGHANLWLRDQSGEIADNICGNAQLRDLVEKQSSNRTRIIIVLSDVFFAAHTGLPAATLAELVFRSGVSKYCSSRWAAAGRAT
jgi:hypothetical protein